MRLDEPDGHQPMVTRVRDVLASLIREDIAPGRGGLVGARQQLVEGIPGGLGLDQAAQAEADVPALVELDALDALAHPRQGAVGQVDAQRVMRGVEDDPLEHHVVEGDALAQPRAARRGSSAAIAGSRTSKSSSTAAGTWARAASRRSAGVAPGSPSTSAAIRSNHSAWRSSSRRCRKKTQAIRLSWEAKVASLATSANGVMCSETASSATRKPAKRVMRRRRRSSGSSGHARVRGEVDGRRIPLQAGHDLGEELGPEGALREDEVPAQRALPELPISHSLEKGIHPPLG